ncbi:spore germination protein [Brevibacillus sp. SYSU BS000544]|uniref:spore germination protein n=1 Tax=Brevibacillus sp. SYSU BS000544 TaxID=3416443 RepID=UPI003CE54140
MFFRKKSTPMKNNDPQDIVPATYDDFLTKLINRTAPGRDWTISRTQQGFALVYYEYLIDPAQLQRAILEQIQLLEEPCTIEQLITTIPIPEIKLTNDFTVVLNHLLEGWTFIHMDGCARGVLCNTVKEAKRSLQRPEVESQIFGPQIAFVESIDTNVSIIRNYVPRPNLIIETCDIGARAKSVVSILYMKDIALEENVQEVKSRLSRIDIDRVLDSSVLVQLLVDNPWSIFPQILFTERPDRVVQELMEGKITLFLSGSPFAIVCPSTIFDFFKSPEDSYVRWNIGSFFRFLRIVAVVVSVLFTPAYVAALTFHYQLIPSAMLVSLAQSRSRVPFPPIMEALILEFMIELLREAGARLPTKVGQTMSIVGGIVIGQAAVQAGFTSNILIIIVALGALASFTTPSYILGNAIRIIRFPMIILAGSLGGVGIMLGICFILLHLLRQTSLNHPFLYPLYPLRFRDLPNSIIRLPLYKSLKRTSYTTGDNKIRMEKPHIQKPEDIFEEPVGVRVEKQ